MPATPTPTLRGEIENVLLATNAAATARWLADELGAPLKAVEQALEELRLEGTVMTRRPRSGHVLWKRRDALQDAWDAHAGPGTFAGRQ